MLLHHLLEVRLVPSRVDGLLVKVDRTRAIRGAMSLVQVVPFTSPLPTRLSRYRDTTTGQSSRPGDSIGAPSSRAFALASGSFWVSIRFRMVLTRSITFEMQPAFHVISRTTLERVPSSKRLVSCTLPDWSRTDQP